MSTFIRRLSAGLSSLFRRGKAMPRAKYAVLLLFPLGMVGCDTVGGSKEFWTRRQVLAHYKLVERDTLKYQAAVFLLDNMKYHYSTEEFAYLPPQMEDYRRRVDSTYFALVQDVDIDSIPADSLCVLTGKCQSLLAASPLPEAHVRRSVQPDVELLSARFVIEHIDHAFELWKTFKYAKSLTFADFKEYLLPYRSVSGYGHSLSGAELYAWFGKYIRSHNTDSLQEAVHRYNVHIGNLRNMGGKLGYKNFYGVYSLYARDFHDCVDIANYGCNILRACGIPAVVEYNITYRNWDGRHYHVAVPSGNNDLVFSPESSLPAPPDESFTWASNLYRMTYGAQENTPYFLHGKDEYVPLALRSPCLVDVTSRLQETVSITLPFRAETSVKLAYLATFNRSHEGMIPVTWGEIHENEVTFTHALSGLLYFPVYYETQEAQSFGEPFYLTLREGGVILHSLSHSQPDGSPTVLSLTRKFPRKGGMIRVAEQLVGGKFLAAHHKDFSDAVELGTIEQTPMPKLQDLEFTHKGAYRYYRFQSDGAHPQANISILEWLTQPEYGYPNTAEASRPHITALSDTFLRHRNDYVKIRCSDTSGLRAQESPYDGNMTTAPRTSSAITLQLETPQVLTGVRFAPLNADNGIRAGDIYELFYWDGTWKSVGKEVAQYEFVVFYAVPQHKLYWLKNHSSGKEEMPFVMQDGQQLFVYDDIILANPG